MQCVSKRARCGRWGCRDLVGGESRSVSAIPGLQGFPTCEGGREARAEESGMMGISAAQHDDEVRDDGQNARSSSQRSRWGGAKRDDGS